MVRHRLLRNGQGQHTGRLSALAGYIGSTATGRNPLTRGVFRIFRVATFNIGQAGLDLFGKRLRDGVPHASERLAFIAEALTHNTHDVDVWLLQEVYGRSALRAVAKLPGYRAYLAESRPRKQATGLAILIREEWPSELLGKSRFPPLDRIEKSIANKGVMAVGATTPIGPVAFGNLHTCYDGRGELEAKKKAPVLRRRQIEKATAFMDRHRDGAPAVLGGDFNFSLAGDPGNHAILTNRGWRDLREASDTHDNLGVCTWSARNPLVHDDPDYPDQDIDMLFTAADNAWSVDTQHIFCENAVPLQNGDQVPLSDHYGLLARISDPGKDGAPSQKELLNE